MQNRGQLGRIKADETEMQRVIFKSNKQFSPESIFTSAYTFESEMQKKKQPLNRVALSITRTIRRTHKISTVPLCNLTAKSSILAYHKISARYKYKFIFIHFSLTSFSRFTITEKIKVKSRV